MSRDRTRSNIIHILNKQKVCRAIYIIVFNARLLTLNTLVKYGLLGTRVKKLKHAAVNEDVRRVVDILVHYSDTFGLLQPVANRSTEPNTWTYRQHGLHKLYMAICEEALVCAEKYKIWGKCLSHINRASPRNMFALSVRVIGRR